jgi:hypothetical protein
VTAVTFNSRSNSTAIPLRCDAYRNGGRVGDGACEGWGRAGGRADGAGRGTIPVVFTGVGQDNLELDAKTLTVPGYTVKIF